MPPGRFTAPAGDRDDWSYQKIRRAEPVEAASAQIFFVVRNKY